MKFQPIKMHTDFTTRLAGKVALLTGASRAIGVAMAKRLDAWLAACASPPSAGFMPVGLRPGWTWSIGMPPAPSPGARALVNPADAPLARALLDAPPENTLKGKR